MNSKPSGLQLENPHQNPTSLVFRASVWGVPRKAESDFSINCVSAQGGGDLRRELIQIADLTHRLHSSSFFVARIQDPIRKPQKGTTMEPLGNEENNLHEHVNEGIVREDSDSVDRPLLLIT